MDLTVSLLKEAFRKLLTYFYFDKNELLMRYEVALFSKSLSVKSDEDRIFSEILAVARGENDSRLQQWLDEMYLCYFPKKVETTLPIVEHNHIVTNIPQGNAIVKRLLVKVRIPVPLMIIDVAWLMLYGYKVDAYLDCGCRGNRLDLTINSSQVRKGNGLYKKFQNQYYYWWNDGLTAANEKLINKENISIVNFDIADCYHSIDFKTEEFEQDYMENFPEMDMVADPLWSVVKRIYETYWNLTSKSDAKPLSGVNNDKHAMPLCLLSAHVLANWYISPIDRLFRQNKNIIYYGRYVDDFMVVVPTRSDADDVLDSINQELNELFVNEGDVLKFSIVSPLYVNREYERLSNFTIQREKLYIYRFDCELPQASIEEYEKEQIERSSEYRFLTDGQRFIECVRSRFEDFGRLPVDA